MEPDELRRLAAKVGHPAGDIPAAMHAAAAEIERLNAEIERMQTAHFDIHARQAKRIDALRPALAAVVEAMVPGVPPSRLAQHSEPWRGAALALWPDLAT